MNFALHHLRAFLAVAEHGTVSAAAQHLHISQPAVSVSIKQLEDRLGRPLFTRRRSHGLSLTPFGLAKLPQARALAAGLAAFSIVDGDHAAPAGHVAFGYFTTLGPQYVPAILSRMARQYPHIDVTPVEADLQEMQSLLDAGRIEVGLSYDVGLGARLRVDTVAELAPYALLPLRHALASNASVSIRDLAREPVILVDLPSSRDFLLSVFHSEGIEPRIGYRVRSLEMVTGLVANGLGVSVLVTRPAADRAYDGQRVARRPLLRTPIRQRVVIVHAQRTALTAPALALAACIREHFANAGPKP